MAQNYPFYRQQRQYPQPGKSFIGAFQGAQNHSMNQRIGQQGLEAGAFNQQQAQAKAALQDRLNKMQLSEAAQGALFKTAAAISAIPDPAQRAAIIQQRSQVLMDKGVSAKQVSDLASADDATLKAMTQAAAVLGLVTPKGGQKPHTNIGATAGGGQAGYNPNTGAFENIPTNGVSFAQEAPDTFDDAAKLRGEFTKISSDFRKQNAAFGRVQASANKPSAAGDLALIFNFMKVLDPGSTVREGEFATAQNAAGVDNRVRALYGQLLSGERLSPMQRRDFYSRATSLYQDATAQHEQARAQYSNLATKMGLNPEHVIVDFRSADTAKDVDLGAQPEIVEGTIIVNPQTNERMIMRGGEWVEM